MANGDRQDDEAQRTLGQLGRAVTNIKERLKFDEDGVKKFTKVFEGFSTDLEKTDKEMKGLVKIFYLKED